MRPTGGFSRHIDAEVQRRKDAVRTFRTKRRFSFIVVCRMYACARMVLLCMDAEILYTCSYGVRVFLLCTLWCACFLCVKVCVAIVWVAIGARKDAVSQTTLFICGVLYACTCVVLLRMLTQR